MPRRTFVVHVYAHGDCMVHDMATDARTLLRELSELGGCIARWIATSGDVASPPQPIAMVWDQDCGER